MNARPEALSVLLMCGYFYAACRRRRVLLVVTGVLAALVYALNVLYLPLALLVPGLGGSSCTRRDHAAIAGTTIIGFGWLVRCHEQARQVSWIKTSAPEDVLNSFIRVGFSTPLSHEHEMVALTSSIGLALGCLFVTTIVALRVDPRSQPLSARMRGTLTRLLALWLLPPLVMAAAVTVGVDVFVERYFTPSTIGIALLCGFCSGHVRGRALRLVVATSAVALSIPVMLSAHAPDGHWGENLAARREVLEKAGPERVMFAFPRDRAVLFSSGRVLPAWQHEKWWASAREQGSLWGPSARGSAKDATVLVVDARHVPRGARVISQDHRFALIAPPQ